MEQGRYSSWQCLVEILQQITSGRSNAEIGEALFISPNTVKNHNYSIYQKTGVKNRIQLASILTGEAAVKTDEAIGIS